MLVDECGEKMLKNALKHDRNCAEAHTHSVVPSQQWITFLKKSTIHTTNKKYGSLKSHEMHLFTPLAPFNYTLDFYTIFPYLIIVKSLKYSKLMKS